ncbi:MAG: nitroreductase family protein [Hoeflea sp.]|uniref:nitroreductase family protein n=1 Tax=Hoeflea sp. TaxID=1940281 RepID=UPI001D344207|nr:nitroreductase family protein [Hoeflea sp.]MBU4531755.1 nitroreductase family protein [Alphaproteobacteria bacterium]MBU4544611.1 nitroreductase family protein [Alphaproteobacteria bacterium]MBU4552842.1 nitroreductase family protein [Alphaproteobacteria bacterium]MBV1725031.1 nitroreductase family protein [Hoeflea sp.]MBV1761051.1 nitroreductase family protein [Hoeflea sp.]
MAQAAQTVALSLARKTDAEMLSGARQFYDLMQSRRTVRDFAPDPVDPEIIRLAVRTAATAPSGANQQPWSFVAISDPGAKRAIRLAAEEEERAFYNGRAGEEWLGALAQLGTDWEKPFLETAPWLIVIFAQRWGLDADGRKIKHYYVPESVSIAIGLMIASLHSAGLATLTHTPSPMGFLNQICGRPDNEKPLVLLVAGHPAKGARVPAINRKDEQDVLFWKTAP